MSAQTTHDHIRRAITDTRPRDLNAQGTRATDAIHPVPRGYMVICHPEDARPLAVRVCQLMGQGCTIETTEKFADPERKIHWVRTLSGARPVSIHEGRAL